MERKEIFDIANALYPTYWISQPIGECADSYIVLKYKSQSPSIENSKAGWQYVDVMLYVPKSSILPLDKMADDIITAFKDRLEFTGNITPDFIDVDSKAIMRSIEFRIPKIIK